MKKYYPKETKLQLETAKHDVLRASRYRWCQGEDLHVTKKLGTCSRVPSRRCGGGGGSYSGCGCGDGRGRGGRDSGPSDDRRVQSILE